MDHFPGGAPIRERFKHDAAKQRLIAQDWCDFASAVSQRKYSREMYDVDGDDGAFDRHFERTKDGDVVIDETSRRVIETLGEQSHLKRVREQIEADDELPLDEKMKRLRAEPRREPPRRKTLFERWYTEWFG
jgi:hypothetical protein